MLTKRLVSPGAEKWLGGARYIDGSGSLDSHDFGTRTGSLELVDYMGGDESVIRVATAGHGTGIFPEKPNDDDFLRHLVTKGISTPFRSVQLQFWMQGSIETALTFVYDTRVSVNEYSGRYSVMVDSSYLPSVERIAAQLHGSSLEGKENIIHSILRKQREVTYDDYRKLMDLDLTRELARIGLGTDNDTKFYWKIDLPTLASFVETQRRLLDTHSITRDFVEYVAKIAEDAAPLAWKALLSSPKKISLTLPSDESIVDPPLSPAGWKARETRRVVVPELEEILFVERAYLDHGAFQVVDYLGDDGTSANAARASYGQGTKKVQENRGLVRALVRDLHTSPIEMTSLAFEAKTPVFVSPRQAARHRTLPSHQFMGYTPLGSQFFVPPENQLRYQDRMNRQGRGKDMDPEDKMNAQSLLRKTFSEELGTVAQLKEMGVPEGLIRSLKGVGFYTRGWRCGDGHNIAHFLGLRLDVHAQKEIRDYAALIADAYRRHIPSAYDAFVDYQMEGMRLSRMEVGDLQGRVDFSGIDPENIDIFRNAEFVRRDKNGKELLSLDGQGYQKKLRRLKNGA
ncbi:FAD-dependent thymidylate synthase [Candidatus Woesearchaeota archaeon]|nr:FAD-dependent thymidylate synthase [Candidatus Woesearchaeota archaeon]